MTLGNRVNRTAEEFDFDKCQVMPTGERKWSHHRRSGLLALSDNVSFILMGVKIKGGESEINAGNWQDMN